MRAACSAHLNLMVVTIFGEERKLRSCPASCDVITRGCRCSLSAVAVTDQVSYPHDTTGQIVQCSILIFFSPKERDHLKDQGVGGKMGSDWILREIGLGCVDWIRLAQDRDR
jgi:hypothetical protein